MQRARSKTFLALAMVLAVVVFFAFDLHHQLDLAHLAARRTSLEASYAAHPLGTVAAFFALYVIVTALSLPGATVLTLAAGALFGLGVGLVTVSFASTIGATLAFLAARHLLRDAVERWLGDRLDVVDERIAREGAVYLFTIRMVPLFPFFVVNLAMGLTRIRVLTFAAVSQVGMLAGTLLFVNAGTRLAEIDSPSDVLSPSVVLSLAALGLFPLGGRLVLGWLRPEEPASEPGAT